MSDDLWKGPVEYQSGSINKNTVSIGVKVSRNIVKEELREMFVNSTLTVTMSDNPETNQPVLEGMEDVTMAVRVTGQVTRYGTSETDLTFRIAFNKDDISPEHLWGLSSRQGALFIHNHANREDPKEDGDNKEDGK